MQPLLKADKVTLALKGRPQGEGYVFEGGTTQVPSIAFNSVMTPISEAAAPPASGGERRWHRERTVFHSHPDA